MKCLCGRAGEGLKVYADLRRIPHYNIIKDTVIREGVDAWFVGGCVRDIILGRDVHDVDLVCFSHDYKEFANILQKSLPSVWVEFKDNIRLVRGRTEIDISKPRGEVLEDDLDKRDFTINNLAMNMAGEIRGSRADVELKVIRHVCEQSFTDDPLRILRAFRFKAQLGFQIAEETMTKLKSEKLLLEASAAERIYAEMDKLLTGKHAGEAVREMSETGIFSIITDGEELSCGVQLAAETGRGLVFFASALFYGLEKERQDELANKLNFPNALKKRAHRTAAFAFKIGGLLKSGSDAEIKKLIYSYPDETDDGLKLFEIVSICDGVDEYSTAECVDRVMGLVVKVDFALPARLDGTILQEIGVVPGPMMGKIIKEVRPIMASGELDSLEEAERYIKERYL